MQTAGAEHMDGLLKSKGKRSTGIENDGWNNALKSALSCMEYNKSSKSQDRMK
jgi:hypothetical protein